MNILGISAFYHDAAAALVVDGKIIAAAQEERFTRKKHDPSFPTRSIRYCLDYSGLQINGLDAVVFYDKPLLKFERLLETYNGFAPRGLSSFITAMPVWLKEKMFLKRLIHGELHELEPNNRSYQLLFPEHHLSHAASAFYPSPFRSAAILTIDGVGEWATASICSGKNNQITIHKELRFPHSLGLLYSAFTYFLGFKVNSGEYKLMGLAPYGDPLSDKTKEYLSLIRSKIAALKDDGSIWLNQEYFNYATGLRMIREEQWKKIFGFGSRKPGEELQQHHCNLALAIQQFTEEAVEKMAREAKRITGEENLCLAGGVALNCVANGKLLAKGIFKNIFIQPASGDAGGAPGAALSAYHIYFGKERSIVENKDSMNGSLLGPESTDLEIEKTARKYKAVFTKLDNSDSLCTKTAELLGQGNVVGWIQGRMEFGPRALGARSILGDARNPEMQKKLNLKIKFRESFRPFAPVVLEEDCKDFFENSTPSPYMLLVYPLKESRRKSLPAGYHSMPLKEKLYHLRSDIPAVTHIDFSARIQTVSQEVNPLLHHLLMSFKTLTGYGMLVNTSFNVRGEPIVCTAEDAYRCFMRTEMDYLVIGNYLFDKKQQPDWNEKDNWKEEFVLD